MALHTVHVVLCLLLAAAVTTAGQQQRNSTGSSQQQKTRAQSPAGPPLKFLPPPSEVNLTRIVANPAVDGTVRRLYLQHLISRTPRNRLRAVLRAMASSTSKGSGSSSSSSGGGRSGGGSSKDSGSGGSGSSIPLDIDYLIEHPDEIVPYFTSRDADEILLLLGGLLHSTAPSDARDLTSAQQARLRAAMDSGELSKWIAQKYRNGKDDPDEVMRAAAQPAKLPPPPKMTAEQMAAYLPPFPKIASGRGSIRTASPPQTVDDMLAAIARFGPNSNVSAKIFGRLDGFRPLRIPIVFHLLGYSDKSGTYLPPYNWWADTAALHMVDQINYFYKGSGLQFFVKEVRWDPRRYRYLNRGDLLGWQNCGKACWDDLSSRYNVQGGPINIWVAGSFEGAFKCTPIAMLCQLSANGLTTINPGATDDWKPGHEYLPTQLVYINYDRFSPDALNRPGAWEGGAVVAAHEIGHYFGLLHTFEGGCTLPNDAASDTPMNLDPDSGWQPTWLVELTEWCQEFRRGRNPDPNSLLKYKSCPKAGGPRVIDNIFNMMSYLDDVCRMTFTDNQVARLQWGVMTYRPGMLAKYGVKI